MQVQHLRIEVVVEDVESAFPFSAFHCHPRADDLGQPVDVARVVLAAPGGLELLAEGFGPGLGTVDPVPEVDLVEDAVGRASLGQQHGERRRACQPGRSQVGQHRNFSCQYGDSLSCNRLTKRESRSSWSASRSVGSIASRSGWTIALTPRSESMSAFLPTLRLDLAAGLA